MAHETLDDVDVLAPAHEARGIAVTPPVSKVPTGHARRGPGLYHQIVQRPRPVTTAEAPVAPGVGEQVRGLGETRPQLVQVLAEHVRQQVGNGDDPRLSALADERDPPSVKVDLLGAQVDQFLHAQAGVAQREKEHPAHLPTKTGLVQVHSMMASASASL